MYFTLKVGNSIKFVNAQDIIFCSSVKSMTDIQLIDKTKISTYKSLKDLEEILDPKYFIRIHAKHIVHVRHIRSINNGANEVHMGNGTVLSISRRRKPNLVAVFLKL